MYRKRAKLPSFLLSHFSVDNLLHVEELPVQLTMYYFCGYSLNTVMKNGQLYN